MSSQYPETLINAENKFREVYELIATNLLNDNLDYEIFNHEALISALLEVNIDNIFAGVLEDVEEKICGVLKHEYNITIE